MGQDSDLGGGRGHRIGSLGFGSLTSVVPGANEQSAVQADTPAGDHAAAVIRVPATRSRPGATVARGGAGAGGRRRAPSAWPAASRGAALIGLAVLTGAGAGVGAGRLSVHDPGRFVCRFGHRDLQRRGSRCESVGAGPRCWFVLYAPVVGGLAYGPPLSRFAPEARGHGVPEVMYAVDRLGGRMRPRVPLVKALASALCIGSGGSVGREGPIVQIGSALGSVAGQLARVPEQQLRLLVACGAAGGISATFNAPIAGVFFALELILPVSTRGRLGWSPSA